MASAQPLLVSSACGGNQKKKRPPLFPVVRFLTGFLAFASACLFIFAAGILLYGGDNSSCPAAPNSQAASPPPSSASVPKCYTLVGAGPVVCGIMWLSPPQAVLALALLLAGGRRRTRPGMALAFVTLAATAANHALFARLAVIICVATSGDTIGTFSAVAFGFYFLAAAVALLLLLGMLAFLLLGGKNAE